MRKNRVLLLIIFLFSVVFFLFNQKQPVHADYYQCMDYMTCWGLGDGGTTTGAPVDERFCGSCSGDDVVCCNVKSDTQDDSNVNIPVEGDDWLNDIFGEGINLNIPKPLGLWEEGEISILALGGVCLANGFVILFLVFIVAIGIGTLKWISSSGIQAKIESAQKWFKNAGMGFGVTILIFVGVNIATILMGVGHVFEMANEFAVCNGVNLYQWKQDNPDWDSGASTMYYCTTEALCKDAGGHAGSPDDCEAVVGHDCGMAPTRICTTPDDCDSRGGSIIGSGSCLAIGLDCVGGNECCSIPSMGYCCAHGNRAIPQCNPDSGWYVVTR